MPTKTHNKPTCPHCNTRAGWFNHPFEETVKVCQKCRNAIIYEAMFSPISKYAPIIEKRKQTKIEKIALADEPFSHRLEKAMDYVHDELKATYCKCTAPIVRTGVNVDEYCGSCGRDIE